MDVSEACLQALSSDDVGRTEIGVMLDRTDRMLFQLRDFAASVHGPLRSMNPDLARRVRDASDGVYRLRNHTTRFLIRSQGPTPAFMANRPPDPLEAREHVQRALMEFGLEARGIGHTLQKDLGLIWRDLQPLIV
jgi:hypothetical protein